MWSSSVRNIEKFIVDYLMEKLIFDVVYIWYIEFVHDLNITEQIH